MKALTLGALLAAAGFAAPPGQLTVIRSYPTAEATARTEVTVTFDRPVAGGLDGAVDPKTFFRIAPAVEGRLEWRDPITVRFLPRAPLTPGANYIVTVLNNFEAMDGTRMRAPYTFSFRAAPARVIGGSPIGGYERARFIVPRPVIRLLLTAPGDPRVIAQNSSIVMSPRCGGARISLELIRMRRVHETDEGNIRYAGAYGPPGDTLRDMRRVVELRPASVLPRACSGTLHVPAEIETNPRSRINWTFDTYGPLHLVSVTCAQTASCPTGPIRLTFSTPVKGAELVRHARIAPALPFTVYDTSAVSHVWNLEAVLKPQQNYAVVVDSLLRDVFGQRIAAVDVKAFRTTSYAPTVTYDFGRMIVERKGLRTIAAQLVNVDTLIVTTLVVPESAEVKFLSQTWRWDAPYDELRGLAVERRIALKPVLDQPFIYGVALPANDARVTRNSTLLAVRIRPAKAPKDYVAPIALVQVTDLAVHGRMELSGGTVWVTGVQDGKPRAGVVVTVYDADGKTRATGRTDAQGTARFSNLPSLARTVAAQDCEYGCGTEFDGYIGAQLNEDRAVIGFNAYDPDLAAWRFDISGAWSVPGRMPAAGAVFTERGIYRPGERVYAKTVLRRGPLGALRPTRGDSVKWEFADRENGTLRDVVKTVSSFGTDDESIVLSPDAALGSYQVRVSLKHAGEWQPIASTFYQVAEYRPPEFLVDVNAETRARMSGDTVPMSITARYLFGAPMSGAQVRWIVQHRTLYPWEVEIPNTSGWEIGSYDWENYQEEQTRVDAEHVDKLDARGALDISVPLPSASTGSPLQVGVLAVVTDANRQTVTAGSSVQVHPASFYIGVKPRGTEYFWRAGTPVEVDVIAVRPTGERVNGADVHAAIVRREWHNVRRMRNGEISDVTGWVSDTVATCRVTTPGLCTFTPEEGGSYNVEFSARDERGRVARTTMYRWAAGPGFVPWRDDAALRVDIIADKERYSVGDTATLLIASPFTNVEAWFTLERETVMESRRIRLTEGATTIKVPITEALAPNVYASILMVRGRSSAPGPLDDPGRPTMRVGYKELRVVPAVKQMAVQVAVEKPEYRPGDSARVRVSVKDLSGGGQRAEVTLWAVDEGVLALTGYQVPDLVDLIYQPRPLGVRLASNLTAVAAQVPEGMKGGRAPGGGGGGDIAGVLRSRFQTTAFFMGSVITDGNGNAAVTAKLPDNLTTFRVMAVAVNEGDRYGSGKSSMLVTRPLLARPALPRFVREGDRFSAGVVVNQRAGGTRKVDVEATARGIALNGAKKKSTTLNGAAGQEVRFDFTAQPGDSAAFQFAVRGGDDRDAVAVRVPVRPSYYPLAQMIAGSVLDTASALITLDQDVDPARSRLEISFGSSTLAIVRGARSTMRVYPYYCTEQVSSAALPLIALYRAQQLGAGVQAPVTAQADIQAAVRTIVRRQRPDGAIGYWTSNDWSTPWLTSYATRVLLEARAAGFAVDSMVLTRAADYLTRTLHEPEKPRFAIARWYEDNAMTLSDRVAAVDVLSRLGRADVAVENTLLGQASNLYWEDRVLLAEVFARRNAMVPARNLLTMVWQGVRPAGRKLTMPDSATRHYFESSARPAARLLTATLAIEPNHPQLGALVETVIDHGRAGARNIWNTQDHGSTVLALMAYEQRRAQGAQGTIGIASGNRTLVSRSAGPEARDTAFALTGLVQGNTVRLNLVAQNAGGPIYYFITVREVPKSRPLTPVTRGIQVERWYERVDTRVPVTRVNAGDLVRVRLRVTIPEDRQFLILDDPLPAGLEAVDLSLRTVRPPGTELPEERDQNQQNDGFEGWYYGTWDSGVWSAFDYKELRDDRVIYFATYLWQGTHTATYLARATTAGTFVLPPAHAEEMYNPGVNGRTAGGEFIVNAPIR